MLTSLPPAPRRLADRAQCKLNLALNGMNQPQSAIDAGVPSLSPESVPNLEMPSYGRGGHGVKPAERTAIPRGSWRERDLEGFRDRPLLTKQIRETLAKPALPNLASLVRRMSAGESCQ